MLERLLAMIRKGGLQTTAGLARELGVTPLLVDTMLADLEQRGYVTRAGSCGDACSGCDVASGCGPGAGQKLWTVRSV
jgi:hypothetical protein